MSRSWMKNKHWLSEALLFAWLLQKKINNWNSGATDRFNWISALFWLIYFLSIHSFLWKTCLVNRDRVPFVDTWIFMNKFMTINSWIQVTIIKCIPIPRKWWSIIDGTLILNWNLYWRLSIDFCSRDHSNCFS